MGDLLAKSNYKNRKNNNQGCTTIQSAISSELKFWTSESPHEKRSYLESKIFKKCNEQFVTDKHRLFQICYIQSAFEDF